MKNSETQKARLNYNGEPLKDNEVLVLMPFFEEDRVNITNPNSIVTVQTSGGPVVAVLKAVPKEFASIARSQFNRYARDEKPVFYGRCLIPQPDGSKKPCPKKSGNNHPDCAHCPHRGEYEREMPRFVSFDELEDEYGYCPVSSPSPEEIYIKEEAEKESTVRAKSVLDKLLKASPKHCLALTLMVQNVQGKAFYEAMRLEHDAATRTMNQIREYVKENGLNRFDGFKASRSSKDSYYREEVQKQLDAVLNILMGMTK